VVPADAAIISGRNRRRIKNAAGAVACAGLIAYALYEQHVVGLEPCHLCILQRIAVIVLGTLFVAAALQGPQAIGAKVYSILMVAVAMSGMVVAARHVWLQHQPPGSVPACGADLTFMLKVLPLSEVLAKVFKGGAECQKVDWSLLGLSMPSWVFLSLMVLGGLAVAANWPRSRLDTRPAL
jgi:disulfide bond formation protein DsbB